MGGQPLFFFLGEGAAATAGEGIVFALAAGLGLAPLGGDKAFLLEAVEDGVQHAVGPLDLFLGEGAGALGEGVAIAFAFGEDGEEEGPGGGGDEFAAEHRCKIHRWARYVKGREGDNYEIIRRPFRPRFLLIRRPRALPWALFLRPVGAKGKRKFIAFVEGHRKDAKILSTNVHE